MVKAKRISSRLTFFCKRVFPVIWFGGVILITLCALYSGLYGEKQVISPLFFAMLMPMIGLTGCFLFKKLVFPLMDEVYDCGDYLLIRKGVEEEQIQISKIGSVKYSAFYSPPRVTLSMLQKTPFGTEIAFYSAFRIFPFLGNSAIKDLAARVKARSSE